jgi:hypothetical protein
MRLTMKTGKKSRKKDKTKGKTEKLSKKQRRIAEREAKKKARKGDGSFPNVLVVTREKEEGAKDKHWFLGHGEDLSTLYKDGQTVAVYKLSRVSTMLIKRKVALVRS